MPNEDNVSYFRFTGPARMDKAIRTLEGLLRGIYADRTIHAHELDLARERVQEYSEFAHQHPFNEIIPRINEALWDNRLEEEEVADLLWLCRQLMDRYHPEVTADMQRLHAIIGAIAADKVVTMEELDTLTLQRYPPDRGARPAGEAPIAMDRDWRPLLRPRRVPKARGGFEAALRR